jgi:sporulation protein YlmC with PRC-barrel domain
MNGRKRILIKKAVVTTNGRNSTVLENTVINATKYKVSTIKAMKRIDLNKVRIAGTGHDRRSKLTKDEKIHINRMYYEANYTQRKLSEMYGVSNQLINFICNPVKHKIHYQRLKAKGKLKVMRNKVENTQYSREKRERIRKLIERGELTPQVRK